MISFIKFTNISGNYTKLLVKVINSFELCQYLSHLPIYFGNFAKLPDFGWVILLDFSNLPVQLVTM